MTPNDGLSLSLDAPGSPYSEGEQIIFELDVENTGQETVDTAKASLHGASFLDSSNCGGVDKEANDLSGVLKSVNQPGGKTSLVWTCSYPGSMNLREGETSPFQAGVEVTYDYETSAEAEFSVVPPEDDVGNPSSVSTDNTAAPVSADIQLSSPRAVGDQEISVPFVIRDTGDGEVDGKVHYELTLFGDQESGDKRLVDGSRTVTKTFDVPPVSAKTNYRPRLTLSYDYQEELGTSFILKGLSGDQT
ncbi:MAG: hypothetical protein MUP63_00680 [Candidatus Nanohaloarchaeota archaeon QJJ-7]|nr:hypothetical protein [Candidatus Nanohaloarchaeota archaeon QJJ-7]